MATWQQVLAWRMGRQHLTELDGGSAAEVARRLCGVQAQVAGSAALAVAVRQKKPSLTATAQAVSRRSLVRTWSVRGTLHLLPPDVAPAQLSLLANAKTWHKGSWQKNFATVAQIDAMAEAVTAALADGSALTRAELVEHVLERTGDSKIADHLRSGWGSILKPLAWQGLLANGPGENGVTFIDPAAHFPGWRLPAADDAAPDVIEAYLGTYGPAARDTFDIWLLRGSTPRAQLRGWFDKMLDDGRLVTVDVDGEQLFARPGDVEEIEDTAPDGTVRLVGGFDQAVLGPGTGEGHVVPAAQRTKVSLKAGWIAPVVLVDGAAVGTWKADGGRIVTTPFGRFAPKLKKPLAAEVARVTALLDT